MVEGSAWTAAAWDHARFPIASSSMPPDPNRCGLNAYGMLWGTRPEEKYQNKKKTRNASASSSSSHSIRSQRKHRTYRSRRQNGSRCSSRNNCRSKAKHRNSVRSNRWDERDKKPRRPRRRRQCKRTGNEQLLAEIKRLKQNERKFRRELIKEVRIENEKIVKDAHAKGIEEMQALFRQKHRIPYVFLPRIKMEISSSDDETTNNGKATEAGTKVRVNGKQMSSDSESESSASDEKENAQSNKEADWSGSDADVSRPIAGARMAQADRNEGSDSSRNSESSKSSRDKSVQLGAVSLDQVLRYKFIYQFNH